MKICLSFITFETSISEAILSYKINNGASNFGAALGGASLETADSFFEYGDESHFAFFPLMENVTESFLQHG